MNYWAENWSSWVGAFLVIAIYTYLWKDNPLYRIIMQVFIGMNVGYQVVIQWRDILYPQWWIPMLDGFQAVFFGGTGSPWGALWAVAGLLGLFWYFQMSRKLLWLSRIVMGVIIGITAGVTIKSQLGTNLPQLTDSFRPLAPSIVSYQPRSLFTLPASDVPPAFGQNLGFFAKAGQIVCAETLSGVELWSRQGTASGPLEKLGNTLLVPQSGSIRGLDTPTGNTVQTFDKEGMWFDASTLYWQDKKIADIAGEPVEFTDVENHLAIVPVHNGIDALDLPSGKLLWHLDGAPVTGLGLSRTTVVYASGSSLAALDVLSGKVLGRFALPGQPEGPPIIAGFTDPLEDKQYALVPLANRTLVAVQITTNLGQNLTAGDVLWSATLPFQPKYGYSVDGQALLTGPEGGAALEIPRPTKRLLWTDYVDNWVFFLTLASVMSYFFFSFRRKSIVADKSAVLGRYMLMIGFGAFFGNTVMTRMSFLTDRLMFLVDEWIKPFIHHFF